MKSTHGAASHMVQNREPRCVQLALHLGAGAQPSAVHRGAYAPRCTAIAVHLGAGAECCHQACTYPYMVHAAPRRPARVPALALFWKAMGNRTKITHENTNRVQDPSRPPNACDNHGRWYLTAAHSTTRMTNNTQAMHAVYVAQC